MKKIIIIISIFFILLLNLIYPTNYRGWGNIKKPLEDGDGSEFIKNIGLSRHYFSSVQEAYLWVKSHVIYTEDPNPPDVWETSTSLFFKILVNGLGRGDCEDISILLCALLRFHTSGGIPDDRVWVAIGQVQYGVHAWVEYLNKDGVLLVLDPLEIIKSNNTISRFKFNDKWVDQLNDIKYRSIFHWNLFKRDFPYEWTSKIVSPLLIIFSSYLFIEFIINIKTKYLFYSLLLLCTFYILNILIP